MTGNSKFNQLFQMVGCHRSVLTNVSRTMMWAKVTIPAVLSSGRGGRIQVRPQSCTDGIVRAARRESFAPVILLVQSGARRGLPRNDDRRRQLPKSVYVRCRTQPLSPAVHIGTRGD